MENAKRGVFAVQLCSKGIFVANKQAFCIDWRRAVITNPGYRVPKKPMAFEAAHRYLGCHHLTVIKSRLLWTLCDVVEMRYFYMTAKRLQLSQLPSTLVAKTTLSSSLAGY